MANTGFQKIVLNGQDITGSVLAPKHGRENISLIDGVIRIELLANATEYSITNDAITIKTAGVEDQPVAEPKSGKDAWANLWAALDALKPAAAKPDAQKAQADELELCERFLSFCKGLPYGVCRGALQKASERTSAIVGEKYI